ncbi:MAG: hypothetical protein FWE03_07290 [Firmicutes bacterium]|nr:hypothetical protein [Bacillota bacterium]
MKEKKYSLEQKIKYYKHRLKDKSLTAGQRNYASQFLEGVDTAKEEVRHIIRANVVDEPGQYTALRYYRAKDIAAKINIPSAEAKRQGKIAVYNYHISQHLPGGQSASSKKDDKEKMGKVDRLKFLEIQEQYIKKHIRAKRDRGEKLEPWELRRLKET